MPGAVEQRLLRQGLRYALGLRTVVIGLSSSVYLVLGTAPDRTVAMVVVVVFNAWSLGYAVALARGSRRTRRWLPLVDVAAVCGACLTQSWTVVSDPRGGSTWILVVVNLVVVTYPWQIDWPLLTGATAAIVTAYFVGATLADPGGWLADPAIGPWTAAQAALSWGLYRFVRRGARAADRAVERAAQLRRAAAVAAARRRDEREYLAALHDTAAATLLMVGGGVLARHEPWLAEQARRDLRELHRSAEAAQGETDLVALLRDAAGTADALHLTWHTPDRLPLPAADAMALSRGVREAVTNVARHAGTVAAEIRVTYDDEQVTVTITDRGVGFDAAQVGTGRYGVTRSLVERMIRVGGQARIDSRPGHGTTVTLTCPRAVPEVTGSDQGVIAASFQRGLRWAVVVLSLAILLLLDLARLLTSREAYTSLWPQLVAWSGLLAVTLAVGVAAWRDRRLGRWRLPLLALVFGLSALATSSMRPEYLLGPAHWSEGDAGWQVVLLMMDARIAAFAAVLVAQYLMTFGPAAVAGEAALSVAGAVSASWAVLAFQFAIAMIAAVLRQMATSSARAMGAAERVRTAEAVARHLHADRADRMSALAATTVPLLEGLASGELDPGDEAVRRSCAAEAARMRRLIAEDAGTADSLSHELRACIELAERNGVTVSFAERGTRPELSPPVRRRLVEPAIAALATASGKARLTVVSTGGTVTVSLVAACQPPPPVPDGDGVRQSTVVSGGRLWVQAIWQGER
ncbi:histidine kinase/DNA gyrase B/HSP90-like ATPase [Micromonospora sp. Llam0]|uniref:sensor histidine kinase n=1 Tax=Micromonospora sp. Llam0 TaxID=2485143 RepID=UPI000FA559D5|nr:ATP-binding protein [Micromonospora sp. Llam0]ROO61139.1 histidine kinase/DNA gyrase B/HSP90-like ATPase [Micromonospora sp. Llam0]